MNTIDKWVQELPAAPEPAEFVSSYALRRTLSLIADCFAVAWFLALVGLVGWLMA